MSLWHANQNENQNESTKNKLPNLESLPELDILFDKFEEQYSRDDEHLENKEESKELKETPAPSMKLPEFKEDNIKEDYVSQEDSREVQDDSEDSIENVEEQEPEKLEREKKDIYVNGYEYNEEEGYDEDLEDDDDIEEGYFTPRSREDVDRELEEERRAAKEQIAKRESQEKRDKEEKRVSEDFDEIPKSLNDDSDEEQEPENLDEIPEDLDDNFLGFIGGIPPDEEDEIKDETKKEDKKEKTKKEKGFKELDEDKAKEFFTGLFGKFKKGNKKVKKSKQPKSEKPRKQKSEKPPGKKIQISGKVKKAILISVSVVLVLIGAFFAYKMFYNPGVPLKESKLELSLGKKEIVELREFKVKDKDLTFKVVNKTDMSKEFFAYLKFDKIQCETDVISVDPSGTISGAASCKDKLDIEKSYKTEVQVEKIQ